MEQHSHEEPAESLTTPRSKSSKRFECSYEGCSKSYTRAEHLARHQLNHNPKDIYKCDFPGCSRSFVRQDLCIRHRERHGSSQDLDSQGRSDSDENQRRDTPRRVGRPRLASQSRMKSKSNVQPDSLPKDATRIEESRSGQYNGAQPATENSQMPFSVDEMALNVAEPNLNQQYTGAISSNVNDVQSNYQNAMPDPFNGSPASIRDDFTAWLFDEQIPMQTVWPATMQNLGRPQMFGDPFFSNYFTDPMSETVPPVMAFVNSDFQDLSSGHQTGLISHAKRLDLIDLMQTRFNDAENADINNLRRQVFDYVDGNEDNPLSLHAMQTYVGSYWNKFHRQMPILHQATFVADEVHELLLLAVMAIGASTIDSAYGQTFTQSSSRFADFVVWHLRWQVFMHMDFRPPAKLWVFQTLLLIETYEKMHSSRSMHERAHVHSATTINLMRRGRTLIGDSTDSMPTQMTPDEAWHRWIQAESMRRAAYCAFIVDSCHAVMFGHAAIMVIHELRLPLPCDDALWSATSAAEVGRVQSSLHTHGIKPPSFLEGLKRTLTGKKVKTNHFGRTILMAGLLSITWHLHQRDLQVSSLGASQSLGMPGTWREALTRSFDFWKRDFDDNMSHVKTGSFTWQNVMSPDDQDATIGADVLHHLSHITLNAEILDCQIFAGAAKVFGRKITHSDYDRAKHKMTEWAKSQAARIAVFHALQAVQPLILKSQSDNIWEFYNSRDDHLSNRAWVLYYALLVLWSYGFALDGVLMPFPSHLLSGYVDVSLTPQSSNHPWSTPGAQIFDIDRMKALEDAQTYFTTFNSCKSPDDLLYIDDGRNRLVGLMVVFAFSFGESKWELLREAAVRLKTAVEILRSGSKG